MWAQVSNVYLAAFTIWTHVIQYDEEIVSSTAIFIARLKSNVLDFDFLCGNSRGLITGCCNFICSGSHTSEPLVFEFHIEPSTICGLDYYRINFELIVVCGQYLNLYLKDGIYSQHFFICSFEMTMTPNLNLTCIDLPTHVWNRCT